MPLQSDSATFRSMAGLNQEALKMNVKLWLKSNNFDYSWLAQRCFVTEATVRNWMAQKPIPAAKEHIIRELIKQLPLTLPSRVHVEEETIIKLTLDSETRKVLEKKAFSQGKTLSEYLSDEVPRLGNPPLA